MGSNSAAPAPNKGVDYYGLLNIPKEASTEEIRTAYKKLALTYHPDRHLDVDNKSEAQRKFSIITAAYETLSDPSKRSLYDLHGVEGLQSGWELVTRIRDPEELKRAFERQRIKEIEMITRKRLHTKSSFVMRVAGSEFKRIFTGRTTLPEVANLNLTQSVNAPVTKKDTATISAGVKIEKGRSSVALGMGWHHALSSDTSTFTEFQSADNQNVSRIGIAHRLGEKTHGAITGSVVGMGNFHNVTVTLERALGTHALGSLSVTYGAMAGVKVLLRRSQDNNPLALELNVGLTTREVAISKTKHVSKKSTLRFAAKVGTEGFGVEAGVLRRVSKFTKLGVSVDLGTQGVTLSFCFQRAGQKYSIPILVSPEPSMLSIFGAILCPIFLITFTKMLFINPAEEKKEKRKKEERKRQNATAILEAKKVAEGDVRLMTATVLRKRTIEETRGGLVVVEARYGKLDEPENSDPDYPPSIDVTIPLQYLVEDSQLILHDGPKTGLLGFYDPRIDEPKELIIRYLFKRKLHQAIISDNEPLQAPLRSHLL